MDDTDVETTLGMIRATEKHLGEAHEDVRQEYLSDANFYQLWLKYCSEEPEYQLIASSEHDVTYSLRLIKALYEFKEQAYPKIKKAIFTDLSLDAITLSVEITYYLLHQLRLHSSTHDLVSLFANVFLSNCLFNKTLQLAKDDPVRLFMELLIRISKCVDNYSGRRAEQLIKNSEQICGCIANNNHLKEMGYENAPTQLIDLLNSYNQKSHEIEKKLILQEKVQVKNVDARLLVAREIRKALSGKKLPVLLINFLEEVWSKYLYITYLQQGMESEQWKNGINDIQTLIWSIEPRDAQELWEVYAEKLAAILGRMKTAVESIHHNFAEIENFFEAIEKIHLMILDGDEPVFEDVVEIGKNDTDEESDTNQSPEECNKNIRLVKQGDWVMLKENGKIVNCKVAHKDVENEYIVMVNYSSARVARKSNTEFRLALENGDAEVMDLSPVYNDMMAEVDIRLQQLLLILRTELSKSLKLSVIQRKKAFIKKIESEKSKALAKEAELAAKKQLELKKKLEKLEEKKKREQTQAIQLKKEQHLQKCILDVNRLNPGGWVNIEGQNGQKNLCKLGMILAGSGKMVFLNRQGMKIKELKPADLAMKIANGKAAITDFGRAYEDSIQSLVIGRRKKLRENE